MSTARMKKILPENSSGRTTVPLYQQVEQYLREQIESGALRSGDMLPTVKDLCEQFGGINHLTVTKAIRNLAEANLVRSVQGRGSFVTGLRDREHQVAIILPHLENALHIRIAKGAQEVLQARGVRSLILDSQGTEDGEADHIQNLRNLPLDGALIFPIPHSNVAMQIFKLQAQEFSFVLVDRYFEDIPASCVVVDNYQGGYSSARHLVERERKRVAWIGELRSSPARSRMEGMRAALNDADIACPTSLIKVVEIPGDAPVPYHLALKEAVEAAVAGLLEQPKAVDGIVCCNDASALFALEALKKAGVRVPEDIALVGFDDIPEAALSEPPLTTVRQPMLELGRAAAGLLLRRLEDKNVAPEKKVLPVELIIRGSS